MTDDVFSQYMDYWGIYPEKRISVRVTHFGLPISGVEVHLLLGGSKVASARSDNHGKAELFIDLFEESASVIDQYSLMVGDLVYSDPLVFATTGVNEVGDDYVTKNSDFSQNINTTLGFIKEQSAGGGGDFPEAVHSAVEACLNLDWDEEAHTKIAFLLLDAPPHYEMDVLRDIRNQIERAAKKGIKIIPITASGINKETEFLMRFMSIATNGTYVFITNDSGIGNHHIAASVGEYEVEFLNDLLVRVMKKYIE